tara:strand:- start:427 stop:1371 length:945 start_codon:yes stop_codon:yes gene_type:complete
MKNNFFEVLRPGINSTFQDLGRNNFYHIGLPFSGAMDKRNFLISNKLVNNSLNEVAIEFAFQGPLLKLISEKTVFSVTGDVNFKIIKENGHNILGKCYKSYILEKGDQLDIISTNKSVYGYLSISGGFKLEKFLNSYSVFTRAEVGANNGKKIQVNQKIFFNKFRDLNIKKLSYTNSKIEFIRILKGTNFDYFSDNTIKNFLSKEFLVTKLTDRMGMRLKGEKIPSEKDINIKSEGLVKGTIQVPGDGNPIIMLSDHGTIGGYPKIGVVISSDYDRLVQLPPNSKIKFKLVELQEAEKMHKLYKMETDNLLNQI